MQRRHPLPRLWLMTDERLGERLLPTVRRLPPHHAGIVFRHYGLADRERRILFLRVRAVARARRLVLLLADGDSRARAWGADGSHGRARGRGLRSAPVHDLAEIRAAERSGADILFLSPVFPTRSHPGAPALGPRRFARLARRTRLPVIALGGVDARKGKALSRLGAWGWAGISALS
ncbi:MAG: thiamine phosphate synthase [Allosphingosinicella sp.]